MSVSVPVILCGGMKEVAARIKANMLPEYDVIYAGYSIALAKREVPLIISGHPPLPSSLHTQLGSNDFTDPPRAIITGGYYSDEVFQELYQACVKACGSKDSLPVPFFRTSNELTDRLAAEGKGPAHSLSEYPKAIIERLKHKLMEAGVVPGMQTDARENSGEIFFF